MSDWTFFSNHGHVLVCLARNHKARLRDVATDVGITERAVQKIVRDLRDAGIIEVTKQGRCNRYRINRRKSLRHGLESHCTVGKLLSLVGGRMPPPSVTEKTAGPPRVTKTASPPEQESPRDPENPAAEEVARKVEAPETQATPVETPEHVPEPPKKPRNSRKSSRSRPVDTRQQGSLF